MRSYTANRRFLHFVGFQKDSILLFIQTNQRLVLLRLHLRTEPSEISLPAFDGDTFFPSDGSEVAETDLWFSWPPILGDEINGVHVQVSAYPDMRYPLSPTFDRLFTKKDISRLRLGKTVWRGFRGREWFRSTRLCIGEYGLSSMEVCRESGAKYGNLPLKALWLWSVCRFKKTIMEQSRFSWFASSEGTRPGVL